MTKDTTFEIYTNLSVVKGVGVDDDRWIVEGIASTSHLDLMGDVVLPENFIKHLDFFLENGKIFYNHGYTKQDDTEGRTPIGQPLEAKLIPEGLYIKCALNKEHPISQKLWKETFSNPDPLFHNQIGMSIGAKPVGDVKRVWKSDVKKFVNYLPDLILYEVSLTSKPVNENTRTWANVFKSMAEDAQALQENSATNPVDSIELSVGKEDLTNDTQNNLVIVKSNFQDVDGNVFEIVVPINKEVLKNIMDEDKDKMPTPPAKDAAQVDASAPKMDEPMKDDVAKDAAADASADSAVDASTDAAVDSPMDAAMGGDVTPPVEGDDDQEGEDSALALTNDKIDMLTDMVQALTDSMAKIVGGSNVGQMSPNDVTPTESTVAPTEMMKSLLEDFKSEILGAITKSLTDSVSKIIDEKLSTATITKSVDDNVQKDNPNLALATIMLEDGTSISLQKGLTNEKPAENLAEMDLKLKSFVDEFKNIRGNSMLQTQQRIDVLNKVRVNLGMDSKAFYKIVG